MSTYSETFKAMAPWRKAVTGVLLVLAIALIAAAITGALHGAVIIVAMVIVAASFAVGPRSPFFR